MPDEIKVGDTVQLKSGGPSMTIEGIRDEAASCVWFLPAATTVERDTFPLAVLRKTSSSGGSVAR
jgi:uncharacterized protein YodC (DUF2158 family)